MLSNSANITTLVADGKAVSDPNSARKLPVLIKLKCELHALLKSEKINLINVVQQENDLIYRGSTRK
jgi:hypothetical protein